MILHPVSPLAAAARALTHAARCEFNAQGARLEADMYVTAGNAYMAASALAEARAWEQAALTHVASVAAA